MAEDEDRNVLRLHIRSTIENVDHAAATRWCLENGQAGMGWQLTDGPKKASWDEYLEIGGSANSNVRRFKDLEIGCLVWTREPTGEYWLGEMTGDWKYRDTPTARQLDLFCTRSTNWFPVGTEDKVPGKVVNAFRSQRTLQRIADEGARAYSRRIHSIATNPDAEIKAVAPDVILKSLIGADDLEDLVAVYLQVQFGYVVVSRFRSTPGYEYVLKGAQGETVVASVKSGETPVDLNLLPSDAADLAFIFAVSENAVGTTDMSVTKIKVVDLIEFMQANQDRLPDRVAAWLRTNDKARVRK